MLIRVMDFKTNGSAFSVTALREDRCLHLDWRAKEPLLGAIYEIENEEAPIEAALLIGAPAPSASLENGDAMRWRKPVSADGSTRMDVLRRRAKIKTAVRGALDSDGFIEIDSPLLIKGTTPDVAVESFPVGDEFYLATSTEYQMKRMAVGGFEKIYSLTQNFRKGDNEGAFRNSEFTMLEWGRVGEGMEEIERDAEALTLAALQALGLGTSIVYGDHTVDMRAPWDRMSVADAIHATTGYRPEDFSASSWAKAAEAAGVEIRDSWREDSDFLFSLVMEAIQPKLGATKPVFICDWPLFQTTSANAKKDKHTADRSELYIAGIEIADGFAGVADPALQEHFYRAAIEARAKNGQPSVSLDMKYIEAMSQGAPYGAGMALGFDRLVMLLTNQADIRNVLAFAAPEL